MKKKIAIALLIICTLPVLLFVGGIWGVYSNQKKITQKVVATLNENFEGAFIIEDSYISPFANFPYISIDLQKVRFFDNKLKEGKALYEIEDLYIGFDVWSVIKGNYAVKSIKIDGGFVDVIQYKDGSINILKAKNLKSESESESSVSIEFNLNRFEINNFEISYFIEDEGKETLIKISKALGEVDVNNDLFFVDLDSKLILSLL